MDRKLRFDCRIFNVSSEILASICCPYLDFHDLRTLDLVCKRFRDEIFKQVQCLQFCGGDSTRFEKCFVCDSMMVLYIPSLFPNLVSFRYDKKPKNDIGLSMSGVIGLIISCKRLIAVDCQFGNPVSGCFEAEVQFHVSSQCKNLEHLGLRGSQHIDNDIIGQVCSYLRIKTLDVGECHLLNDKALQYISQSQLGLEHLDIGTREIDRGFGLTRYAGRYSNDGLEALARGCPNLKSFIITNNLPLNESEDDDECWKGMTSIIAKCRCLELLDISVNDPTCRNGLGVTNFALYDRKMSKTVLDAVLALPQLRILHMGGTSTTQHLDRLSAIINQHSKNLKWVGFQQTELVRIEVLRELDGKLIVRSTVASIKPRWGAGLTAPAIVFRLGEVYHHSELCICYGFHNHERADKRWLEWPIRYSQMKEYSNINENY